MSCRFFNTNGICGIIFFFTDDGYLETETTKLKLLNSTRHMAVYTITPLTEKPLQNSEFNTNYLLVGVGIIISIILFIILIQLCKNSKSAYKKQPTQQKRNDNEMVGESSHRSHSGEEKDYKTISSSRDSSHSYRQMDTVYHEIDECMELMPTPALPNAVSSLDSNTVLSDFKHTAHLKSKDDGVQTSNLHVLPSKKITSSDTSMSKLNPQHECVLKNVNTENKEEIGSYVNVTEW